MSVNGTGIGLNEFGTPISMHICDECGAEFTLCPPAEDGYWGGKCLAKECASYDPERDADKFFEGGDETWKLGRDDADDEEWKQ